MKEALILSVNETLSWYSKTTKLQIYTRFDHVRVVKLVMM